MHQRSKPASLTRSHKITKKETTALNFSTEDGGPVLEPGSPAEVPLHLIRNYIVYENNAAFRIVQLSGIPCTIWCLG